MYDSKIKFNSYIIILAQDTTLSNFLQIVKGMKGFMHGKRMKINLTLNPI